MIDMTRSGISIFAFCLLFSCDKELPIREGSSPKLDPDALTSDALESTNDLRASAKALALDQVSGRITEESLQKLNAMGDQLLSAGLVTEVLGSVPDEQLTLFKGLVFETVKQLAPKKGQPMSPKYLDAVRLVKRLKAPEGAAVIFEHLEDVPAYHFPAKPLPGGWPSAELSEHYDRGVQGLIARTVVEFGDEQLVRRFRSLLDTAEPELKRVMIWALGKSPENEDFERLWQMREQVSDAGTLDTLARALNAITVSMGRVADYPECQVNRTGLSSAELKANAARAKERLADAQLLVALTLWD